MTSALFLLFVFPYSNATNTPWAQGHWSDSKGYPHNAYFYASVTANFLALQCGGAYCTDEFSTNWKGSSLGSTWLGDCPFCWNEKLAGFKFTLTDVTKGWTTEWVGNELTNWQSGSGTFYMETGGGGRFTPLFVYAGDEVYVTMTLDYTYWSYSFNTIGIFVGTS
jgi:hypothetical protein